MPKSKKPASLDAEAYARQADAELEQLRARAADQESRIRDLESLVERLEIDNAALTHELSARVRRFNQVA